MESLNSAQQTPTPAGEPLGKPADAQPKTEQPSVQPSTNSIVETETTVVKGKSKTPLIILSGILLALLLLIASGAFLALVTYGKVDLNNKELERKISLAIQSLPFTPKTAEYLINQSFEVQENTKSAYIDASIAIKGAQTVAVPGLDNNFDLKIVGPIDLHDEENPEAEINIKMSPELDADFLAKNDKIFFRIKSIPAVVEGFIAGWGLSSDLFMRKWIAYDMKSLESDARNVLDEDSDVRDEEKMTRLKTAVLNSDIIEKIIVTETEVDGKAVYQLSLEMISDEYKKFVDEIARAIDPENYTSDLSVGSQSQNYVDNIKINTYLDKQTIQTVKSTISFRMNQNGLILPSQVLGASTIQYFPNAYKIAAGQQDQYVDVAVVINASKYNEDFEINEPTDSVPLQTIIEEYTRITRERYEQELDGFSDDSSGFSEPEMDKLHGEIEEPGISGFSE